MGGSSTLPRSGPIMRAYSPATSAVLAGPNVTPTPQKALGTPGNVCHIIYYIKFNRMYSHYSLTSK